MQSPYGPPDPGAGGASSPYRPGATTTSPYAAGGTPAPALAAEPAPAPGQGQKIWNCRAPAACPMRWAAASIQGEDGRTEFQMIADEVDSAPAAHLPGRAGHGRDARPKGRAHNPVPLRLWCVDLPGGATYTRWPSWRRRRTRRRSTCRRSRTTGRGKARRFGAASLGRRKAVRRAEACHRAATLMAAVTSRRRRTTTRESDARGGLRDAACASSARSADKMVRKMLAEARRLSAPGCGAACTLLAHGPG